MGRSPRVRGSPRQERRPERPRGSIPACAGQPRSATRSARASRVDPRVCGAAAWVPACRSPVRGRSPRVRGSRVGDTGLAPRAGSIPACAGQPFEPRDEPGFDRVDPRVCGAALRKDLMRSWTEGRSPRVRGSLRIVVMCRSPSGSIPACAGQPVVPFVRGVNRRVDPRVCGAAWSSTLLPPIPLGRSPRVRGSRARTLAGTCRRGSIPACAGQPGMQPKSVSRLWVDPRVCGAALQQAQPFLMQGGRSPRVRGSHATSSTAYLEAGSIPACAGQPSRLDHPSPWVRVDPRVCGAAALSTESVTTSVGRSPRVRGSRRPPGDTPRAQGSIPACAGQPDDSRGGHAAPRVDPRVCGAA